MKEVKLYSTLILLFVIMVSAKVPAPAKSSSLEIKGYVFKDDQKVENATVKLYQHNKIVEISLDGYITERIQISTLERTEFSGKYMYEFRVDLMDDKEFKGVDISDLDFPTALIKYNPEEGEYLHDEDYSKSVNKQMKALKAQAKGK